MAARVGRNAGWPGGPKRSKFNAQRAVSVDGRKFASKAERDRYHVLLAMQDRGEISELQCQPLWTFSINGEALMAGGRRAQYRADFLYRSKDGRTVCEDVKGMMTPDALLRIGLMKAVHGIEVQVVGKARRR